MDKNASSDETGVIVGRVCWSLSGEGIGELVKVSRFDAYQMGASHALDTQQAGRTESLRAK